MKFIENPADKIHSIELRVKPNSPKFKIKIFDKSIDVYVTSPPSKGRANKEIYAKFAKILEIPSTSLQIVRGIRSSIKILRISDITGIELKNRLSKANKLE